MKLRTMGLAAALATGFVVGTLPAAAQSQAPGQTQQQTAREETYEGTIAKNKDGKFALEIGGNSYVLDNQEEAARFEGMKVRITGTFDKDTNSILVKKIEEIK